MIIIGVDEVGRGALIGNVIAAAIILPCQYDKKKVADSKSLSEKKREVFADYIKSIAIAYAIGKASPEEIDQLNIHHATLLAMRRAIDVITHDYDEVWVDGKFTPVCHRPIKSFIKGDSLYDCISAASILAKTYRDQELRELDCLHPQYGFALHKGYPTKAHRQALEKFGVLSAHRRSYKTIKKIIEQSPP